MTKRQRQDEKTNGFAICGYAGTGKDTLIQDLQRHKLFMLGRPPEEYETKWQIYSNTRGDVFEYLISHSSDIKRYSFADALKLQVHDNLKLKNCPADAFEHLKNDVFFRDPNEFGTLKTIRSFYIEHGRKKRAVNPDIWTEIVHAQIQKDRNQDPSVIDMISDFRFENELLQLPKYTIRVFRKDVVAAPASEDSEHSLDTFKTTFLLIPPGDDEWVAAIKCFPQYTDFYPSGVLVKRDDV